MATVELICQRPWRTPRWLAALSMTSPLVDLESKTVDVKWREWVVIEVPDGESQLEVAYYSGGFTMSRAKVSLDLGPDEVAYLEYRCSLIWLRKGTLRRLPDRGSA